MNPTPPATSAAASASNDDMDNASSKRTRDAKRKARQRACRRARLSYLAMHVRRVDVKIFHDLAVKWKVTDAEAFGRAMRIARRLPVPLGQNSPTILGQLQSGLV